MIAIISKRIFYLLIWSFAKSFILYRIRFLIIFSTFCLFILEIFQQGYFFSFFKQDRSALYFISLEKSKQIYFEIMNFPLDWVWVTEFPEASKYWSFLKGFGFFLWLFVPICLGFRQKRMDPKLSKKGIQKVKPFSGWMKGVAHTKCLLWIGLS